LTWGFAGEFEDLNCKPFPFMGLGGSAFVSGTFASGKKECVWIRRHTPGAEAPKGLATATAKATAGSWLREHLA
jgi:hypothetical protein